MRIVEYASRFKRDYRREKSGRHGSKLDDLLTEIVDMLAADKPQPRRTLRTFAADPHRGSEQPKIRPGIRTVTNEGFVFYFEIDEPSSDARILATFFAGADHRRQILDRLRH